MSRELFEKLDPYDVIVFDHGGVLHSTHLNVDKNRSQHRSKVIQELMDLESLLSILSYDHRLVILTNSPKKRIEKLLEDSGISRYFRKVKFKSSKTRLFI
jgi:FMN phosphatase YigB (HAD superfamily)